MGDKTQNLEECLVVRQDWIESEKGWGQRPDGCSLHKTVSDCKDFIDKYWSSMPYFVPNEYDCPVGEPYHISIPKELYNEMMQNNLGMRIYGGRMHKLKDENLKKHC